MQYLKRSFAAGSIVYWLAIFLLCLLIIGGNALLFRHWLGPVDWLDVVLWSLTIPALIWFRSYLSQSR